MSDPEQHSTPDRQPGDPAAARRKEHQLLLFEDIPLSEFRQLGYSPHEILSIGRAVCSSNKTRPSRSQTSDADLLITETHTAKGEAASNTPVILHYGFIERPEVAIVPRPEDDAYLEGLPACVLAPECNEKLLTLTLAPDLLSYYKDIGLSVRKEDVVEVNPRHWNDDGRWGYPNTNSLVQMRRAVKKEKSKSPFRDGIYVPAFTSIHTTSLAEEIGLFSTMQHTTRVDARPNDKEHFRRYDKKYGYNVLPGVHVDSEEALQTVGLLYTGSPAWLKLSKSSGGDGICYIQNLNLETLRDKVDVLKGRVMQSFRNNRFTRSLRESVWKPGDALPNPEHLRLVLEVHAPVLGPTLVNGSSVMVVSHPEIFGQPPEITVPYLFEQLTGPEGQFRGSRTYTPDDELKALIMEQHVKVATYLANELNYFGIVGLDFMVVIESGEPKVYCMEVNARAPVSAVPRMLMYRLGAKCMHQQNVSCPNTIASVADFEMLFQHEEFNPIRGTPRGTIDLERGIIVPLALKTMFSRDSTGHTHIMRPSNELKVGIFANSFKAIDSWLTKMRSAGILHPEGAH